MLLLLTVFHIIAIVYFVYVGIRWLALLPIAGIATLLLAQKDRTSKQQMTKERFSQLLSRYAFAIAWCFVLLGIWGIADIYILFSEYIGLWLIGANIILWIGAYLFDYAEGKQMFHIGYYVASAITFWSVWGLVDPGVFGELLIGWVAVTMAIYAFIVFIVGTLRKVEREMSYPLFVYIHLCAIYLIYYYANADIYLALVLAQVYLMVVYCIIRAIQRYSTAPEKELGMESQQLRHILSGKDLTTIQPKIQRGNIELLLRAHRFLDYLSPSTKFIISFFNVILIIGQVYYFIRGSLDYSLMWIEVMLWFGIIAFFVNYLLLKAIDFYYEIQRLLAFILINFGIYFSILNIFGYDVIYLMLFGIVWSILNSLAIFQARYFTSRGIFERQDFMHWIGANVLATLVNIYLIFLLPVSLQLRFSIGAVYFGVQFFLLLYNMRHIQATVKK